MRWLKPFLSFALWVLGFLSIVVAIMSLFFVDRYAVGHNAMAPTMLVGENVLAWREHGAEFGDVVVCPHPNGEGQFVIGRVVAREGAVVTADRGTLLINGETPERDVGETVTFYD